MAAVPPRPAPTFVSAPKLRTSVPSTWEVDSMSCTFSAKLKNGNSLKNKYRPSSQEQSQRAAPSSPGCQAVLITRPYLGHIFSRTCLSPRLVYHCLFSVSCTGCFPHHIATIHLQGCSYCHTVNFLRMWNISHSSSPVFSPTLGI